MDMPVEKGINIVARARAVRLSGIGRPNRYLYVMKSLVYPGWYKIGITGNPARRISEINTHASKIAAYLKLYAVFNRSSYPNAASAELYLHDLFASKRVKGEWFELDEEDLDKLHDELTGLKYDDGMTAFKVYDLSEDGDSFDFTSRKWL